jgi:formylglycine-generating enzyme required for sulfatase activity
VSKETGRDVRLPTEAQWEKAASWDPATQSKRKYPWGNEWDVKRCSNGSALIPLGFQLDFKSNDEADDWWKNWKELQKNDIGKQIIASGGSTTPVGSFPQGRSAYGCYDMAGNVFEWCWDWYKPDYYTSLRARMNNPEGPSEEDLQDLKYRARVERGGAWFVMSGWWFRCILRCCHTTADRTTYLGFRIVCRGSSHEGRQ